MTKIFIYENSIFTSIFLPIPTLANNFGQAIRVHFRSTFAVSANARPQSTGKTTWAQAQTERTPRTVVAKKKLKKVQEEPERKTSALAIAGFIFFILGL